jgi:nucleoside-diphosphate-sugar epimerase
MIKQAGHEVVGLDSYFFRECSMSGATPDTTSIVKDIRDVELRDLLGFEAVIHLAALSNDPLGDLDPALTYEINYRASVRLAQLAKEAGVSRFLFSSSCSLYGASGDDYLDENAPFNPVTAYGESKILVEDDVRKLADSDFSPTFLRNATAYGLSDRLRADLVVNNLTGYAFLTGSALIKSDGLAWRPLVHVEDISRAFLAALEAPREAVHNESFNVGRTEENYLVRDVAEIVKRVIPGSEIIYAGGASADTRNYRVNCDKIARRLPAFQPQWNVLRGVLQLYEAFQEHGLTMDDFLGSRYQRIMKVRELLDNSELDTGLRWRSPVLSSVGR